MREDDAELVLCRGDGSAEGVHMYYCKKSRT